VTNQGRRQTPSERGKRVFHRVCAFVRSEKYRRFVFFENERLVADKFLPGTKKFVDRRLIVSAINPFVRGAKFEFGDFGLLFDGINRGE